MPMSALPLLGLPVATLALALGYPAQGRHAVVLSASGQQRAVGWLTRHGATIAGSTDAGVVVRIPDDRLAVQAAAAGVLLLAVPQRLCGPDGGSA